VAKGSAAHPALNMCESCFQHECNGAGAHAVLSIAPTPAPTRLSFATAEAIARGKEEVHIAEQKAKVRWLLFQTYVLLGLLTFLVRRFFA
jgi:hypothetical protein